MISLKFFPIKALCVYAPRTVKGLEGCPRRPKGPWRDCSEGSVGWSASCRCRVVVIVSQDHRVLEAGLPMLRFASFWDPSELVRAVAAVVQVVVLGQVPSSHVWSGDLLLPTTLVLPTQLLLMSHLSCGS